MPLMKGGANAETLQQCANLVRRQPDAAELEALLSTFASLVMDIDLVKHTLRWDMQILRESPIYQELMKEGHKLGLEEGLVKGHEEGLEEGLTKGHEEGLEEGLTKGRFAALVFLRRFLAYRFGVALNHFDQRFPLLDLAAIEKLSEAAFEVETLADFEAALARFEVEAKSKNASSLP